mmetsp:Transcript_30920/g.74719  ORF Transcript_30920/g.74719 Transcript_30920/m.74719 type:complete len:113 (+) Transcript_30920:428-766(+)
MALVVTGKHALMPVCAAPRMVIAALEKATVSTHVETAKLAMDLVLIMMEKKCAAPRQMIPTCKAPLFVPFSVLTVFFSIDIHQNFRLSFITKKVGYCGTESAWCDGDVTALI